MLSPAKIPLSSGLYVISVPIGNIKDITLRALETLNSLDKIYCEDTRVTKKLLSLYNIPSPPLIRCDDYAQQSVIADIKSDITNGLAIGLVSDAGTPLISDPGYVIIEALQSLNIPIFPISGISAAIAALSVSGLPTTSFQFKGFIPKKESKRLEIIEFMANNPDTYIFYERPERLGSFLNLFPENFSNCLCFIAREISKLHEEYHHATLSNLKDILTNMTLKGEAVFLISTHQICVTDRINLEQEITLCLQNGLSVKDITKDKNLLKHASRNQLYALAEEIKNKP